MASIPFRKSFPFSALAFWFSLFFCLLFLPHDSIPSCILQLQNFFLSHQFVLDLSIFLSRCSAVCVGVYCYSFFFILHFLFGFLFHFSVISLFYLQLCTPLHDYNFQNIQAHSSVLPPCYTLRCNNKKTCPQGFLVMVL